MSSNWSSSSFQLFCKMVSVHLYALPNFLRRYNFNNERTEATEKNKVAFVPCPLFSRCSVPSGKGQGSAEYCSGYCSHRDRASPSYNRSRNVQWSAWKTLVVGWVTFIFSWKSFPLRSSDIKLCQVNSYFYYFARRLIDTQDASSVFCFLMLAPFCPLQVFLEGNAVFLNQRTLW